MKYKNMKTETVDKPSSIYATEKPSKTKGVMLQSTIDILSHFDLLNAD